MKHKVLDTIQKYHMLSQGDSVLVGLSGGADSCTLLHCLCSLRETMSLTVYACHVHHGLRGEEADRDEHFTRRLCDEWHVPLFVLHADVAGEARRRKVGTEECGREIRYAFFEEKAEALGAKIATAHTASDNAETVLFHLTRGSGMAGLGGIPPCRGKIIRPLIEVTRSEIEDYCRSSGLSYVTDSTNLTNAYSRNRIRLEVIPSLKQLNPSLERTIGGLSQRMREAEDFLMQTAETALEQAKVGGGYRAEDLQKLHTAVFSAAVRKLCMEFALIPEAKHLALLRKIVYNGGAVEIRDGVFAAAKQGIFRIYRRTQPPKITECSWYGRHSLAISDKKFLLFHLSMDEFHNGKKNNKFLFANSLDYDTIPLSSCFRTRRSGDSFTLLHRNVTKPVRKLFIEQKIPQEQRDSIVLLADGSHVLWIEGIGAGRDYAVTENTKSVLLILPQPAERTQL